MFVQMDSPQPKKGKDEDIEAVLKQVEAILRNSPQGTGFSLHLVTCPAKEVLNLVSTMRDVTPSLEKIRETCKSAEEYKIIRTPQLVFASDKQMMIPSGK